MPRRQADMRVAAGGDTLETALVGGVIVDLAAERGGNCEVTVPGDAVTVDGVTVLGPTNLPA